MALCTAPTGFVTFVVMPSVGAVLFAKTSLKVGFLVSAIVGN